VRLIAAVGCYGDFLRMKLLIISLVLISLGFFFEQYKLSSEVPTFEKYVVSLTAADKVELLAVRVLSSNEIKDVDCHRADIICKRFMPQQVVAAKTLSGVDANLISMRWRKLRPGNGAGCFGPAYILRFYQRDELLLETDVCFHCCNITLPGAGGDGIVSMCGDASAIADFHDFVVTTLPYPRPEKKP
jgi:hypothetical protein